MKTSKLIFLGIVLILTAFVIYSNSFKGPFHFDDYEFILNNEGIRHVHDIKAVWRASSGPTRFITYLSFAINYHVHKFDVFGYHAVNFTIHVVNSFLVWIFIALLLKTPKNNDVCLIKRCKEIGFVAALLFLTHPIQTQAVSYITQRFASLATFFYLMTIIFYLLGRRESKRRSIVYFVASFISGLLGMLTKQIVLTLPIIIILIECIFLNPIGLKNFKKNIRWKYLIPFLILLTIIPSLYKWNISWVFTIQGQSRSHAGDLINSFSYFITQPRVICTYLRLLFLPIGQNLDYDFAVSHSIFEPKTFLAISFLGVIFLSGFKIYKKNPLITFGIFWYFITLSVESSIIPILQVIFEHRNYLPSVGFVLILSVAGFKFIKNFNKLIAVFLIIIITFSYLAYQRNKVWVTEISLWSDVIKKSPKKTRGYHHLGVAYLINGENDKAFESFNQAIELDPKNVIALHNRGVVYQQTGQLKLALLDYTESLNLDSNNPSAFKNRGVINEQLGNLDAALNDYSKAIELNSSFIEAYQNRINLCPRLNKKDLARADLMKLRELGETITDRDIEDFLKSFNK